MAEHAAALLIELPQRELGGLLPSWDDLVAQTTLARAHGTATHLDGARLLESLPFYDRPAAEVADLFDSVYLSLYKGVGGLAGCVLAGEEQLVAEAREWRHRHGGTLFAMWPYAAAGLAGLRRRAALVPRYVEHARAVCAELAQVEGLSVVPDPPQTNMAHLYLRVDAETYAARTPGPRRWRRRPGSGRRPGSDRAAGTWRVELAPATRRWSGPRPRCARSSSGCCRGRGRGPRRGHESPAAGRHRPRRDHRRPEGGDLASAPWRPSRRSQGRGVPVVFVTGRPPRWMAQVAERTGHTGLAVCANGALVYDLRTRGGRRDLPDRDRGRPRGRPTAAGRDARGGVRRRDGGRASPTRRRTSPGGTPGRPGRSTTWSGSTTSRPSSCWSATRGWARTTCWPRPARWPVTWSS